MQYAGADRNIFVRDGLNSPIVLCCIGPPGEVFSERLSCIYTWPPDCGSDVIEFYTTWRQVFINLGFTGETSALWQPHSEVAVVTIQKAVTFDTFVRAYKDATTSAFGAKVTERQVRMMSRAIAQKNFPELCTNLKPIPDMVSSRQRIALHNLERNHGNNAVQTVTTALGDHSLWTETVHYGLNTRGLGLPSPLLDSFIGLHLMYQALCDASNAKYLSPASREILSRCMAAADSTS
jgi:hypothetical protein